jgi:hypothetical protein
MKFRPCLTISPSTSIYRKLARRKDRANQNRPLSCLRPAPQLDLSDGCLPEALRLELREEALLLYGL